MIKHISILILLSGFFQFAIAQNTSPTKSIFKKEHNGFWLYVNGQKQYPQVGMVYQPTQDGRHINYYKGKFASLYSALLPESKGGKGHGLRLKEMGISLIRVYELPTENQTDIDSIKHIFEFVHENYGIQVLVGDWAGLYSNIDWTLIGTGIYQYLPNKEWFIELAPFFQKQVNNEFSKLRNKIRLLARIYCKENWVLGWQIGNENNYYTYKGKLGEKMRFHSSYYYIFMDYYAGELRKELAKQGVQQFIGLGQGDLTNEEAVYIMGMKNIDAIGINCYRDPTGKNNIEDLIELATILDRPIYFAEYGKPTIDTISEKMQSDYLQQVSQIIFSNSAGRDKRGHIFSAFLHEATDEKWKESEHGNLKDASYGILGKLSEKEMGKWIIRNKDYQRAIPENDDPVKLLASCWNLLQGEFAQKHGSDYGNCIAYANRLIEKYQSKADSQQIVLLLDSLAFNVGANDSLWALNSVGTAYFIKGRCNYELASNILGAGDEELSKIFFDEAKKDFSYVTNNYPYSHLRSVDGTYNNIKDTIRKLYPEFSEPYIKNNYTNLIWFVLLPFLLITHFGRFLYLQLGNGIRFLLGRKKVKSKILNKNVLSVWQKIVFSFLILAQLFFLFQFIQYWYHPIRYEYYFVNPYLYWTLTIIGSLPIIFYLYIWFIIWGMKIPQKIIAQEGHKVAMATTFVAGEPIDMLEFTLEKMTNVSYPHDTYLLDESNDDDIKDLCGRLGVKHFSRKGIDKYNAPFGKFRKKTKAGNLNSWLDTHGDKYEFVVFLDPDHAPLPHFLDSTLGFFQEESTGFVQAPQVFRNTHDNHITKGAAEQSFFFFGPIQMGLYGLGSCMLNGSHTTLRIDAINKVGEYAVHDADDVLMSIKLRTKGYSGIYTPEIVAVGLVPDTWKVFLNQQRRWAASVFNLMTYHYPVQFLKHGWNQVITYYFLGLFYLTGMLFSVLLILPIFSVFTNWAIVNVDLFVFLKEFLPFLALHYLILLLGQFFLIKNGSYKGIWFKGGLLWIGSWAHFIKALISGVFKRKVGDREVTAKGNEQRPKDSSKKSKSKNRFIEFIPHLTIVVLSIGALIYAQLNPNQVEQTRGMQLFLLLNILLQGTIFFLATRKEKSKEKIDKRTESSRLPRQ